MKLLKYFLVVAFIVVLVPTHIESKGGRGGGFRSGGGYRGGSRSSSRSGGWFSSSRRSSSSVVTSRPRSSYGRDYYGARRSSSSVVTSRPRPSNYASKVTTPKTYVNRNNYYNGNRQPTFSGSNTRQTYYVGGGYYGSSGYYGNRYSRNRQNKTSTEYYNRPGSPNMINPVLAGLGGSALGMYLGYQLSGLSNTQPGLNGNENYPRYSVVHHYHHGDQPIVKNAKIEENDISKCNNIAFCVPNTQPLCLTNGTVYCLTAVKDLINCVVNLAQLQCVNTTLAAPCINNVTNNCTDKSLKNVTAEIPCLTNVYLLGDVSTGKLGIYKKDEIRDENALSNIPAQAGSALSDKGILNEYCVTVIANPVPVSNLSNAEYLEQTLFDKDTRDKLYSKFEVMLQNLLH